MVRYQYVFLLAELHAGQSNSHEMYKLKLKSPIINLWESNIFCFIK